MPIAADGNTFDEAVMEMVDALREYAEDWQDHLLDAPNHRDGWGLVQLIGLRDARPAGERVGARRRPPVRDGSSPW